MRRDTTETVIQERLMEYVIVNVYLNSSYLSIINSESIIEDIDTVHKMVLHNAATHLITGLHTLGGWRQ